MDEKQLIVAQIDRTVKDLNDLFKKAASHYIKFDCGFNQSMSFGKGKVAHLDVRAYKEISLQD